MNELVQTSDTLKPTERTTVRRRANRGSYDRRLIESILDEALCCHVGFVIDGQPYVIPTTHVRVGELLYLHGAAANRMLRTMAEGGTVCVTVTLIDGLVLARSAAHHSVNYRSVVILGQARLVDDATEKRAALDALLDHAVPGRRGSVRPPTDAELRGTLLVALPIEEASAKVRVGPPVDEEADRSLPVWAGEIPLRTVAQAPRADPSQDPALPVPPEASSYQRPQPTPA